MSQKRASGLKFSCLKEDKTNLMSRFNLGMGLELKTESQVDIEMERDWNKATTNSQFVFFPNRPPYRRKGKNQWTDANQADIA